MSAVVPATGHKTSLSKIGVERLARRPASVFQRTWRSDHSGRDRQVRRGVKPIEVEHVCHFRFWERAVEEETLHGVAVLGT